MSIKYITSRWNYKTGNYELIIVYPDGEQTTEEYASMDEVIERRTELETNPPELPERGEDKPLPDYTKEDYIYRTIAESYEEAPEETPEPTGDEWADYDLIETEYAQRPPPTAPEYIPPTVPNQIYFKTQKYVLLEDEGIYATYIISRVFEEPDYLARISDTGEIPAIKTAIAYISTKWNNFDVSGIGDNFDPRINAKKVEKISLDLSKTDLSYEFLPFSTERDTYIIYRFNNRWYIFRNRILLTVKNDRTDAINIAENDHLNRTEDILHKPSVIPRNVNDYLLMYDNKTLGHELWIANKSKNWIYWGEFPTEEDAKTRYYELISTILYHEGELTIQELYPPRYEDEPLDDDIWSPDVIEEEQGGFWTPDQEFYHNLRAIVPSKEDIREVIDEEFQEFYDEFREETQAPPIPYTYPTKDKEVEQSLLDIKLSLKNLHENALAQSDQEPYYREDLLRDIARNAKMLISLLDEMGVIRSLLFALPSFLPGGGAISGLLGIAGTKAGWGLDWASQWGIRTAGMSLTSPFITDYRRDVDTTRDSPYDIMGKAIQHKPDGTNWKTEFWKLNNYLRQSGLIKYFPIQKSYANSFWSLYAMAVRKNWLKNEQFIFESGEPAKLTY